MGWQEELRRLDAELADGHVTHDQHRRLRDELLASASGGAMASPRVSPLRRSEQVSAPAWYSTNPGRQSPPSSAVPEPPPDPVAPDSEPAKRPTPASALLGTDRPTTAPSPADHRRTESMAHPPLDQPTQVLRPVPALPPLTPSGGRLPPPEGVTTGGRQQQGRRGKFTWIFISLGVLLVLALIIGGAWWLGSGTETAGDASGQQGGAVTSATFPNPGDAGVALEDRLPVLPGRASPNDSTVSVEKGAELGFYSSEDAKFMTANGAKSVIYRSTAEGDRLTDGNTLLVVKTKSRENAAAIVEHMRGSVTGLGFTPVTEGGTTAMTGSNSAGRLSVDWYPSANVAVGIGVSQALGDDPDELNQRLQQILSTLEPVVPRSG